MSEPTVPSANPPGEGRHEALAPRGRGPWRGLFIALAVVVVLAIVATLLWFFVFSKGGGGNPTNPPTSSPPTSPPPVTPPPVEACAAGEIIVTLGTASDPGAGQVQVPINFENTGSVACTLEGFPAVVMLWQDGSQFGAPATDEGGTAQAVVLEPGGEPAQALLTIGTAADACASPLDATGFQVTPPGGEPVVAQGAGYQGCEDTSINLLKVSAIAGAGG